MGVGVVLQQILNDEIQPLSFFSKKLTSTETRYDAFGRELLVIYLAVEHFQQITIFTGHKPLSYSIQAPADHHSPREIRSLDLNILFTNDIRCIDGLERDVYVKTGEKVKFCCELNLEENQALVFSHGLTRLRSLSRMMTIYKQVDASSRAFFDSHPGYYMVDKSEQVKSLCIEKEQPGADLSDNNLQFKCDLIDEMGLGTIIATETITIKIYEPPVITPLPAQLESVVNGPVSLKCSATGRPDLKLYWINESNGDIFVEEKSALPSDGELELTLTLDKVTAEQDGQKLICEASTSYPPEQSHVRQYTEISVNYPPRINFSANPIYTALEANEEINITVYGKPKPDFICTDIDLTEPREMIELPDNKPGLSRYVIRINSVTEDDLGNHMCSATNKFGTDNKYLQFTLTPSKPEVVSPPYSNHADYYLLGWRSMSKSPMRNATFKIKSYSDGTVAEDTRTVSLNDPMVAKGNTTSDEIQEFWHHLDNLAYDSEHTVHIRACNEYDCTEFDLQVPNVKFKTLKDSSYKIDPSLLLLPPTASLRAATFHDGNGSELSKAVSTLLTLLALTFALNL
nr:gag pol polyprotein [Hymenolepis microstoma]